MESTVLYDIHGFVKEFLVEPADTAARSETFEHDLLSENMLENAHHMGRAGVANPSMIATSSLNPDWGRWLMTPSPATLRSTPCTTVY